MKKNAKVGVFVVVTLVSLIAVFFNQSDQRDLKPTPLPVVKTAPTMPLAKSSIGKKPEIPMISQAEIDTVIKKERDQKRKNQAYHRKITVDKDFAESELQRLIAASPRAKRMYQLVKAATLPIEFHGKIIDKTGSPLSNVEIKYSVGKAYGMGQPTHSKVTSDGDGRYIIKAEGATVSLNEISLAAYQFPDSRQHFYTATESGRPNTWRDHGVSNPYVTVGENQ